MNDQICETLLSLIFTTYDPMLSPWRDEDIDPRLDGKGGASPVDLGLLVGGETGSG